MDLLCGEYLLALDLVESYQQAVLLNDAIEWQLYCERALNNAVAWLSEVSSQL